MAAENGGLMGKGIKGLLFFGGLEIGYNVGGQTLSSPQTTELRVAGKEGGGAAEATLYKWVHLAAGKVAVFCALVSFITRSWYPMLGGIVAIADTYASYKYAIVCGRNGKSSAAGKIGAGAVNPAAGNTHDVYKGPPSAASGGDLDAALSPPFVGSRIGATRRR